MTVKYFSLYNSAIVGAAAGMSSQKQALYENNTVTPVTPADSTALLTTCTAFAVEVDATLQTLTPSSATNVTGMVAAGATVVPTTAALANASAYLPAVLGLMAKGTFDGRGVPTDESGVAYTAADWAASLIPNALSSYFLAFAENAYTDNTPPLVPKFVPLANVAMGAAMAGMITNRQELYTSAGASLTPASFPTHVATAQAFALQVDAALTAAQIAQGVLFPTNVASIVTENGGHTAWGTTPPTTAALTNALYSLVPAMGALCKAIFDNRGIPKDASGAAFIQSDYTDIANTVVAQFLEYAANVQTT